MTATLDEFRARSKEYTSDHRLREALANATWRKRDSRQQALLEFPNPEELRDHFKVIRSSTLSQLRDLLEVFERNAQRAGAHVHWAQDATEACEIVIDIAHRMNARLATKSKSMTTEEIHLNQALAEVGIEAVETDLGEWIIQLADEPPSHIVAPAIHKTREEVAELFSSVTGEDLSDADVPTLVDVARRTLRQRFLNADMGISGGNLAIAETGSIVLVTNEGNGRFVTSAPPVHVAIIGIEKIASTWNEAAVWLSLLARNSTGQPASIYTSIITGPAHDDDPDGPGEVHIILLDNGRSRFLGTKYEEVLQCIRCGACLNVCPVYREVGGHAYGSPYSGPIGAVLSPLIFGLSDYAALPHASSLCGACKDVCPVFIDLPRMLLELRADEVNQRILPWWERRAEELAASALYTEGRMQFSTGLARILQKPFLQNRSLQLPSWLNPSLERKLPSLAARPFRKLWRSAGEEE